MVRDRLRRVISSPVVDWFIRLAVIGSLVATWILWGQLQTLTHCVAEYNNINNERSQVLIKATDEERTAERRADDAQAALFTSPMLSKPAVERTPAEQAEILRLFHVYQMTLSDQRKERADADAARRVHPIPDPPSQVCG